VEDNLSNLTLIEQLLEQRPAIRLISAMQGGLGLELARHHRPDLILLDLHLPDMHGAHVLETLRADPATHAIPVIILSADATPGQIGRLLDAGANDYLMKPLDLRRLLELLDEHLGLSTR
jgi:CheY-like chemotaxis protein